MGKKKMLTGPKESSKELSKIDLDKIPGLTQVDPVSGLLDKEVLLASIMECIADNDPNSVIEMLESYYDALETAKKRKLRNIPKST